MAAKPTYEELEQRVKELEKAEFDRKKAVGVLGKSEPRIRKKLDGNRLPNGDPDVVTLDLATIIDIRAIQSMMDDFFNLTDIGIAILDLQGKVLVATGWQDICIQFHRTHPESCKNCMESDLELSNGVEPGTFRLYRCQNNMWDMATPITVGDKHVGNLYLGQFLFEEETPDLEVFRSQAQKYGFNEREYLAALERVPRWSRETVNIAMTFYTKLAHMISELSYSNIKIAQTLKERDKLLNSLRESEAFLKTLINAIPTPIFHKDRDGKYLWFNNAFETFFGETKERLIGKSVFDIHPPELAEIYHAQDTELFNSGGIQRYDSQMKNAQGELRDIIFNKAVYTNSQGIITGLIGAIIDITERKQVEEALHESEKKFSTLFQASPVYIAFTALDDGCFLDVNDAFTKITGFQRNEVLGRTPVEIGLWFDPKERAKFIKLVRQNGDFYEEEVRFRRKNGDPLLGIWSAEKIELGGKACLISVLIDDTERKKTQEALRQERDKLRAAISEIKTLSGLFPICSNCKKIRDDQGYWNQIEKYIGERSNAEFSHGICPECAKKLYPDFDLYNDDGELI